MAKKTKNSKKDTIYVVLNTKDLSLRATKHKTTLAIMVKRHRNSLVNFKELLDIGDLTIREITIE